MVSKLGNSRINACHHHEDNHDKTNCRSAYLIKRADGRNKDDRIGIFEIWYPSMPLSASAANIVEMPSDQLPMDVHVENMLRNAHCLDSGMQYVI